MSDLSSHYPSDRLFPADLLYEWLSYGGSLCHCRWRSLAVGLSHLTDPEYFAKREISYAIKLEGSDKDPIIRFLSFADFDSFRQDIKQRTPIKIDIGAIYTHAPKNKVRIRS